MINFSFVPSAISIRLNAVYHFPAIEYTLNDDDDDDEDYSLNFIS